MTTQTHATLNLRSVGVKSWLNKNDISIESRDSSHRHKRFPPELQPKSKESHSSDTKQTIVPPFYSHSRSRTGSQGSFVTNHTDIDTSITSEAIASRNNNHHFQANKYKKMPATLRKNYNPKYRMSMSTDSTKIQSLQLITPRSCSNTPSRESRDRALCGSLIEQSRRRSHTLKHHNNDNHHSNHVRHPLSRSTSKSNAKTPKALDPIIQNSNSDIDDYEVESIETKSKLTNNVKGTINKNNTRRKKKSKKSNRKRSGSSLLSSSSAKTSKSTQKSYKSKQSKSTILTKKSKQKQFDPSSFRLDEWLSSMDILKYKEIFDRDGFDKLGAIVELNSDDLREMNIPKGHCKMILRQVHNLQNALDIKPLQSMHCRHRSNPDTNRKSTRKHSSHSTQSHSDPVIPPIDVILAFEDENDAISNYESCDFPDIDAGKIDLNKVHGHKQKTGDDKDTVSSIVDTETADYHTFPRTSTIGSVLPPNDKMRHSKTPHTNAALQSLRVAIPQPIDSIPSAPAVKPQTSDTSTSSLPSFHPTNLNEDEEKISAKPMHDANAPESNNYSEYNMLPQYYRYQLPQQAQRYMVYHPQQNIVYDPPNHAVHYDDALSANKRYTYRHRRYDHQNTKRYYNNQYFISDEHKESHRRRHSISSTASNDYVLYQKATGYDCDEEYKSGFTHDDEHQQDEKNKNGSKKKKKWLSSRVYKRKKNSKSKSKPKHKQSNSGPLIAIISQTNSERGDAKNKDKKQCNRMPWFLCGSSKNSQKNKAAAPNIDAEEIDSGELSSKVDASQIQTRKHAKSKSKSKTKTKSKKHTIIISTPREHSYSYTNSQNLMTIKHGSSQTITPYSSCHDHSASSYDKTPEFIPRQAGEENKKKQGNINMSVSLDELDRAKALNEAKELHRIGNLQCAAEKYAQFLHYFRNDIDARIRYSLCLLDLGQYELCSAQLDSLIECDPKKNLNNSMLRFVYGLLQHKLENYSEALQHYNAALLTGYVYQDRIYNNLASLFRACKDYEKAEKYQLLALNLDNRNYVAYQNYAKILCDIHRYDDATKQYQNAISLRPDLVDLRIEFALFLMDIQEDYLLAATELNTAHKLAPENSEVDDLLKQAIEYCGNDNCDDSEDEDDDDLLDDLDDLDDVDDIEDIEDIGDDNSDTLVLLSPEQSTKEEEEREDDPLFSVMAQLQLNMEQPQRRRRKESLPINLPRPRTAATYGTHSDSTSTGYSPLKLAPREKSSSKSTRKSICGSLPPPHNPLNPNDPVRRNSLLNMNRSQLTHYLRVDDDDNDDAVSVMSDLSMLSDEQQI